MTFCLWRRILFNGMEGFEFGYIVIFTGIAITMIFLVDFIYKKLKRKKNR